MVIVLIKTVYLAHSGGGVFHVFLPKSTYALLYKVHLFECQEEEEKNYENMWLVQSTVPQINRLFGPQKPSVSE